MPPQRRPGGRTHAKRRAILEAARAAFLAVGFEATSMDDVAVAAGVSKRTIYHHFHDKQGLFRATVAATIDDAASPTDALIVALAVTTDLAADLRRFARQHVIDVTQPHVVSMRRRLIAETERFPDLAATWYLAGPAQAHRTLAKVFAALSERGLLAVADPLIAAEQFNAMLLVPLQRAMFIDDSPSLDELNRTADAAVCTFLAAHSPATSQ